MRLKIKLIKKHVIQLLISILQSNMTMCALENPTLRNYDKPSQIIDIIVVLVNIKMIRRLKINAYVPAIVFPINVFHLKTLCKFDFNLSMILFLHLKLK